MPGRLRIESPEHAAVMHRRLAALEKQFREGAGDPAAIRDLARQIIRLRTALTSYSLRLQVRDAHDRQATANQQAAPG